MLQARWLRQLLLQGELLPEEQAELWQQRLWQWLRQQRLR